MSWYVVSLFGYTQQANASAPEIYTPVMVPYALVLPCVAGADSDLHSHFVDVHASTRMLQLGPSVREVLCLHACDKCEDTCPFDAETRAFTHSGHLADGEEFYMYGRKQGYPPRIA
jgi:ferredoxin